MFYLYYLLYYFGMGIFGSFIILFFTQETALTAAQVTTMMSFIPVVGLISQNFFAYISDKTKKYKQVLFGTAFISLLINILFIFGMPIMNSILLVITYILFIFFYQTAVPLADNFTLEFTKRNNTSYGTIRSCGSLAYAVAGQVGGILTQTFGLSVIFYVLAICTFLTLFLIAKFPNIGGNTNSVIEETVSNNQNVYKQLLKNKEFINITICSILILGGVATTNTFLSLYVVDYANMDLTFLGTLILISAGIEVPMMIFSDKIIKKITIQNALILAASVNAIRFLTYFFLPYKFPILIVTALHGIGYGLLFPAIMGLINNKIPSNSRVTAISLNNALVSILGTMTLTMFGSMYLNAHSIFLLLGCIQVLAIAFCIYLKLKSPILD